MDINKINLPVYFIDINDLDETGMNGISLVEKGAVCKDFICFNKDIPLNFYDEEKRIVTGVVARANYPIYRNLNNGSYVVFTPEVIEKMVKKYSKMGLFNNVNLNHDDYSFVDNVYMIESYIVNRNRGICPNEFSDIEEGSWICSFYVDNEDLWNEIKNNHTFNGFSLQGLFLLKEPALIKNNSEEDDFDNWLNMIIENS